MNVAPAAVTTKKCNTCLAVLPIANFGIRRDREDGLALSCKPCRRAAAEITNHKRREKLCEYREKNRVAINERKAIYRETNREVIRERERERTRRHVAENGPRKCKHNPERRLARRLADPEGHRKRMRELYGRKREAIREYQRKWYRENREKFVDATARRRARLRGAPNVERIVRAAIIARDQSICHICDQFVPADQMSLDHVIPLARGGDHTVANLRVAHLICNKRKRAK